MEVAHLSDLHFGTEQPEVVAGLYAFLERRTPSLVIVSGDFTQRARVAQFRAARACLERLPKPQLVVPGNHDQPLWDFTRRIVSPLGRYRRFITSDLQPMHAAEGVVFLGIDTPCRWVWKRGRMRPDHLDVMRRRLSDEGDRRLRVLVTHHPLLPAPGAPRFGPLYGEVELALGFLRKHGPAVLLAGHLHLADTGGIHATESGSLLAIQAGTAISRRLRNQPNAFNWLELDDHRVRVTVYKWDGARFAESDAQEYVRIRGWERVE